LRDLKYGLVFVDLQGQAGTQGTICGGTLLYFFRTIDEALRLWDKVKVSLIKAQYLSLIDPLSNH
jgi:hypothetical protein